MEIKAKAKEAADLEKAERQKAELQAAKDF